MARRQRLVAIIVDGMKHGMAAVRVVSKPLPEDARYVGATFDPDSLTAHLIVEAESFDDVREYDMIPVHAPPTFEGR